MTKRNTLMNPWRRTSRWRNGLLGVAAALFMAPAVNAQVATYSFAQSSGTYTPITGGTLVASHTGFAAATNSMDDDTYNLPAATIPFTFTYDGVGYTGFNVNSNGYITFGATAPSGSLPISSSTAYAGAISAMGRDTDGGYTFGGTRTSGSNQLTAVTGTGPIQVGDFIAGTGIPAGTTITAIGVGTIDMSAAATATSTAGVFEAGGSAWSNIRIQTLGTTPNQVFVIQWSGRHPFGTTQTTSGLSTENYQIRLYETSNAIEVVYNNCSPGVATATTVRQVGLRGPNNTFATNVNNRLVTKNVNDWSTSAPGTANTSGCVFNNVATANVIPNGLTYAWTPPAVCMGTPDPGTVPATASACNGNTVTLAATALTTGTNISYQWEESPDGIGSWSAVVGGTGATTATYTTTAINATRYFRIVTTCSTAPGTSNNSNVATVSVTAGQFDEDFSSGTIIGNCWSQSGAGTPANLRYVSTSAYGVGTGSIMWDFFTQSSTNGTLIYTSPVITPIGSGMQLEFDVAAPQYNTTAIDSIYLEQSSNGGTTWSVVVAGSNEVGSTFNTLPASTTEYNTPASGDWQARAFPLTAGTDRVRFRGVSKFGNNIHVDNIALSVAPSCSTPTNLTATNETASGADLGWTENGTATAWDLEIGVDGFSPTGTPTDNDVPNTPYTWANGTPATDYDFYVRADCNSDDIDVSPWAGPFSFITLCSTIQAPFTEGFDVASATAPPNCWSTSLGAGSGWEFNGPNGTDFNTTCGAPGNGATGTGSFAWVDYSTPTDVNVVLNAPIVDVSALTNPLLRFDRYMCATTNAPNPLYVEYYDGSAWQLLAGFTTSTAGAGAGATGWRNEIVNLTPAVSGGLVQIRFRAEDGGGPNSFNGDMGLDEIYFEEAPPCPNPGAVTADNETSVGAEFSWIENGTATAWDLEIGLAGFTPTGTPTLDDVASNPYTWTGGSATTNYHFYIRADCGMDNIDVSTWVGPIGFTTLCATEVPDYSEDFSTYLPNCWAEATGPITGPTAFGSSGWLADGFGNIGTTGSARVEIFSTGGNEWLLTPLFDLSAGGYELNFDVALTQWNATTSQTIEADDAVYLMQSTDGGTTWTTINTWNNGNSPSNTGNNTTINIAAVTSANVQFGFFMLEGPTSGGDKDFFVDNFKVRVPPTCDATAAPANEDCIAGTYDILITDVSVTGPGTVQYTLNNGAVQSVPFTSPTTTIAGLNVAQAANITLVTDAGCTNKIGNVQSACAVELDCAAAAPLPFSHCYSTGDTRTWYFHTPEVGGAIDLKFLPGSELGAGDNVIFWNGVPGASVQIGSYSGDMSNLTFTGQTNQYLGVSITTNGSGSCEDGLDGTAWNFTVRCSGCTEPVGLVLLPPDNGEAVDCSAGTFEASVYVESFGINGTGPNAGSAPATTTISWTAGGVAQPNIVLTQTSDESGTLTSLGSWPVGVELDVTLLHGNGETVCNNIIGTDLTIPYSACPPANDICANATVLTIETPANCPGNQVIGTTLGAGQEVADPTCPTGVGAVQDVWYSVNTTGFANGTLTVTPITATAIGAQFYSACGTTPIGSCISPVSVVNFNFPPGPYLIRFYTTEANAGTFNICMSAPPPAANDEPCTATPLALGVGDCVMTSTTNVNATNSTNAGIPAPGCSSFAGGDIWFTTVVGPTGIVTFDSEAGTVTDIGMVVYTSATDCNGPFTLVECDDDDSDNGFMSRIVLSGRTPGEVLYIRVFEYGNNAIGTFSICASEPPLNNNCAGAISLDPSTLACTGANGTTASATQSLAGCTGNANDDVWYSFVATETSHVVRVSGVGTFNPVLQLINGGVAPDCNALGASIVCQNATGAGGLEEFTAVGLSIGNTYFVRVYDFGATNFLAGTTSFNICVTKVPTCLAPTATASTGITTGTAFANWTPNSGGSGSNFIVEYGLASNFTTPGTGLTAGTNGTVILNAVSPRSLGALAANTQYRYFVRQNCTGTSEGFSFNSNGITFTTLALPPANDECAGAVLLSGSNTTCINTLGTIAGSTRSLPAPDCAGTADDDVWYKFVAEGAGNYTINVNGTPGTLDGVHQLFSGNSCGALTQVACSDPAAMTVQGLTAGQTYFIRVYSYSGVQPTNKEFNICVVKNADCLPPTTITTSNITSSSADVNVAGSLSANYILEYGLQSNFTTPGLAGTAGTNGTVIAFTGNLQQISGLALTTGYRYFVRRDCGTGVYSGNSTAQTFTTLGTPPVNDLCANAIAVTCGNSYAGSNVNATADGVPSQTPGGTATVDDGVWWKYVGNDQTVTLSLCGVSFDTRIHVFAGACGTLVGVAGNDDFCGLQSTVTFGAASGTTYFIAVESFGSISGTINMAVSCGPYCAPPSNNACANAQLITPSPIGFCDPVAGTTACATSTAGANPSCATLFQSYQDVYYTFTAAGSAHPMQVNVLSGTLSYWALYEATCGGQQDFCSTIFGSQVSVTGLTPGAVYKIRIGSQVDADFNICIGAPTCSQDVTVEWQLGATGAIPAWEMRQIGTNVVVASGGGFNAGAPFAVYPETACLPEGKFYFDMLSNLDAGGGYKVRLGQAPFTRLIDNTVAVGSNSITELTAVPAALGSNGPLQIPVGPNELLYSSCDKYFWAAGEYIVVNEDPQVAATWLVGQADAAQSSTSGYDFWFYNPDGGYSYIRQRRNNVSDNFGSVGSARTCHMKVNNWAAANHIPNGAQLNVRVRAVVNNVPKNWGPACRFVRDEALAACTPTKLFDIPGHFAYSCNVFRAFNTATANRLYARPVGGATKYRFHIYNGETDITLDRTVYYLTLGWTASVATVLQDEAVYDVTVQAFVGGVWCPVGEVCTVQICNTPASCTNDIAGGQQNSVLDNDAAFLMWPNPNNGALLNVNLSGVEEGTNTVSMDVFDLSGKRIIARTLAVQGGFVSQVVDLNGEISTGMYMVRVTAGDQVYSERLVIQK